MIPFRGQQSKEGCDGSGNMRRLPSVPARSGAHRSELLTAVAHSGFIFSHLPFPPFCTQPPPPPSPPAAPQ
uniref:Uncharacterized protein n=1 Tax=Leersia perrieri TaxID=77586 RepID=A0A0D9WF50_9ORYZ